MVGIALLALPQCASGPEVEDPITGLVAAEAHLERGEAEAADATLSHVLRGDLYYAERSSIGLMVAGGEEAENIGVAQLIITDVTSVSLVGQHQIDSDWHVLWSVGHHKQGNLYKRKGVDIAVRYRY